MSSPERPCGWAGVDWLNRIRFACTRSSRLRSTFKSQVCHHAAPGLHCLTWPRKRRPFHTQVLTRPRCPSSPVPFYPTSLSSLACASSTTIAITGFVDCSLSNIVLCPFVPLRSVSLRHTVRCLSGMLHATGFLTCVLASTCVRAIVFFRFLTP